MKKILLSTALVGFAGAAAADGHLGVTFSGDAKLGYNDFANTQIDNGDDNDDTVAGNTTTFDNEFGFYSELDVTIGFAAELDNGLTAAASIDFEKLASGGGNEGADYELSLTSDTAGLYYGDTNFAAQNVWVAAGDMAADNFSEQDGEEALRGEATFGAVSTQLSYAIDSANNSLEQLSIGVAADFGGVNVVAAYQEATTAAFGAVDVDADGATTGNGDFNTGEVFGLSVGTSFSGADVRLAYADNGTEDSIGVSVSYPIGPVTVDASYAVNSVTIDKWNLSAAYEDGPIAVKVSTDEGDSWALEGSYDVGNGLTVFAGVADAGEDFYVAGEYDLGGGASMLVSFAEDGDTDSEDEIGAKDYQEGTTVELSFEF